MSGRERPPAFHHRVDRRGAGRASPPAETALGVRSPVTLVVMGLCVAVFLGEAFTTGSLRAVVAVPSPVLMAFGANHVARTLAEHRFEALVASAFVHGSLLHLGMNMAVLRWVGPLVEGEAGSARAAPLYLVSAVTASVASCVAGIMLPGQRLSVGASGAILGFVGSLLVIGIRTDGWSGPLTRAAASWLATLVGFGFVLTFLGQPVDNAAHVGGALGGILVALSWRRDYVYPAWARATAFAACGLVLLAVALGVRARAREARFEPRGPGGGAATSALDSTTRDVARRVDTAPGERTPGDTGPGDMAPWRPRRSCA